MAASVRTSLACAIVILVFAGGQTLAATLCVDPNNPACFRTIQEAIDAAYDFDTIEVHPAVYREHISYNGAMLTVRSLDPNDPAVVESTIIDGGGAGSVVKFHNSEGPNSVIRGLTIRNGQNGIECSGADVSPLISKCRVTSNNSAGIACSASAIPTISETSIENNKTFGIMGTLDKISLCRICNNGSGKDGDAGLASCSGLVHGCVLSGNNGDAIYNHTGSVKNCLISGNLRNGFYFRISCGCGITNCTIVGNQGDGISFSSVWLPYGANGGSQFTITNCLLTSNRNLGIARHNTQSATSWQASVAYSDMWGNILGDYGGDAGDGQVILKINNNNICKDPLFAKRGYWDDVMVWHEGDYHLKSMLGRWDPRTLAWVTDPMDSPCLDRGDPASAFLDEPSPNGDRINLGAYGGTPEASKSPGGASCTEYPAMDFNHDCKVDQADLDIFMRDWLDCGLDPDDACWPEGKPSSPHFQP